MEAKAKVTRVFFDRKEVDEAIGRGAREAWSKFGAYVRQRDKTSIRYKKGKSPPGSPPYAHRSKGFTRKKTNKKTGEVKAQPSSPLRELITFAFDLKERSVVIGPEEFRNSKIGGGQAPAAIEYGGTAPFYADGRIKVGHYRKRPHTGPAFKAELPKAPQEIKDKIK